MVGRKGRMEWRRQGSGNKCEQEEGKGRKKGNKEREIGKRKERWKGQRIKFIFYFWERLRKER